jgi:hypothetical protein
LPAGQDYPIRLDWPNRDRVLPLKDFGAAMFDRHAGHVPMSDLPDKVTELMPEVTTDIDAASATRHHG